jgi:hypothetical protein
VENSQGAEEAVEALKNLASLASDLDGMMRQFHVDEESGTGLSASAKPAFKSSLRPAHA